MALLPPDPRQRKSYLLLMAALVIAGWAVIWYYGLEGRRAEIQELEQQVEALKRQNERSRLLAARGDDLRQRLELQERMLAIFEELIPESEEVPNLLDAISQEAQLTGVELSRIRPQAPEATQFYTKQTWELSVLGDYHQIGRYLARIASLPRIIKPTTVQLTPAPRNRATRDMDAPLEASFRIETFVLGAGSGAGPASTTQGASSGD